MTPIERPDWGDGESRAVVPADADAFAADHPAADLAYADPTPSGRTAGELLDPGLLEEWRRAGGVGLNLKRAQDTAENILNAVALAGEDDDAFQASFDGLPEGVDTEVYRELALVPDWHVRHASEADIERFKAGDLGELANEWRGKTAHNLGVVNARLMRLAARLSDDESDALTLWFDNLSVGAAKAVLRALVR